MTLRRSAMVGALVFGAIACVPPTSSDDGNNGSNNNGGSNGGGTGSGSAVQELRYVTGCVTPGSTTAWFAFGKLPGLDYRMMADQNIYTSTRTHYVQFRNRYYENIHFSYNVRGGSAPANVAYRIHIAAGGGTSDMGEGFFQAVDCQPLYVLIGQVRFGADDSGPYVQGAPGAWLAP